MFVVNWIACYALLTVTCYSIQAPKAKTLPAAVKPAAVKPAAAKKQAESSDSDSSEDSDDEEVFSL